MQEVRPLPHSGGLRPQKKRFASKKRGPESGPGPCVKQIGGPRNGAIFWTHFWAGRFKKSSGNRVRFQPESTFPRSQKALACITSAGTCSLGAMRPIAAPHRLRHRRSHCFLDLCFAVVDSPGMQPRFSALFKTTVVRGAMCRSRFIPCTQIASLCSRMKAVARRVGFEFDSGNVPSKRSVRSCGVMSANVCWTCSRLCLTSVGQWAPKRLVK